MRRNWTEKRIWDQLQWTNECYHKALWLEYHPVPFCQDYDTYKKFGIPEMKDMLASYELPIHSDAINTKYLDFICKLDTEKLELIIDAYNKGKQYRSALTIDVIMSELLERVTNSETKDQNAGEG
jgi:hypothetical protein